MKTRLLSSVLLAALFSAAGAPVLAADYDVDPAHSFVEFRIKHLGYSWLYGRFNTVTGSFSHDPADPTGSNIAVEIDTTSVDTRHAERDKDLRENFLEVDKYPTAAFKSTAFKGTVDGGTLEGELTVHGVTKPVSLEVKKIGEGKDPWGGYRAGFHGTTTLIRKDFGIVNDLGPASESMELQLSIEGIRQ